MGPHSISLSVQSDEKTAKPPVVYDAATLDTAAVLTAGAGDRLSDSLDPAAAARLRRKIDLHLMPLMCSAYPPHSLTLTN
ncbi:hypothetical protein FA95DRAFT_6833 [Auriscalpium vulgare]|uniref:Uncharacterized protein n=1 Tax=Auriscalpium vulgare TaxID=40419 RepID=A0ACB8SCA1_9AGAM|nr:hypothetical protein FA95DRAFT_6833 [Auriscalpium vulgare]